MLSLAHPTPIRTMPLGGLVALAVPVYVVGIAGAEVLAALGAFSAAVALHAVIVFAAVNHYLLTTRAADAPRRAANALLVLPLPSMLRIVSLTTAQAEVPRAYRYLAAGLPLLVGAAAAVWFLRPWRISPILPLSRLDLPIALAGLPLGYAAFRLARPTPLYAEPSVRQLIVAAAIVFVFTGLTEELVFRGVLLEALTGLYGRMGVFWSALLSALVYAGVRPVTYAALVAGLGLVFAWLVDRTESLPGVAVGRGLMNVGLIVVWPWLLG